MSDNKDLQPEEFILNIDEKDPAKIISPQLNQSEMVAFFSKLPGKRTSNPDIVIKSAYSSELRKMLSQESINWNDILDYFRKNPEVDHGDYSLSDHEINLYVDEILFHMLFDAVENFMNEDSKEYISNIIGLDIEEFVNTVLKHELDHSKLTPLETLYYSLNGAKKALTRLVTFVSHLGLMVGSLTVPAMKEIQLLLLLPTILNVASLTMYMIQLRKDTDPDYHTAHYEKKARTSEKAFGKLIILTDGDMAKIRDITIQMYEAKLRAKNDIAVTTQTSS